MKNLLYYNSLIKNKIPLILFFFLPFKVLSETPLLIPPPDSIIATINVTDVVCFGENTGSIQVSIQQGSSTPPYIFSWSGPNQFISSAPNIYNLYAGSYLLIITDANAITNVVVVNIEEPIPSNQNVNIQTSNYNGYHIACKGESSGAISVMCSYGFPPYSFLWSTGSTNNSIENLSAGIYGLEITDDRGCKFDYEINLTEPEHVISGVLYSTNNYNGYDISCFGFNNGALLASPSGGVSPYNYSWSNGEIKDSAINLFSGYYWVLVRDKNYCLWQDSIFLTEPSEYSLSESVFPDTCGKGVGSSFVISSGGVPPYSYNWNNGEDSLLIEQLFSGNYELTSSDMNQCEITTSVFIDNLESPKADFLIYSSPARLDGGNNSLKFVDISESINQKIVSWQWNFGDNQSGQDSLAYHSYTMIGEYSVHLSISTEYNCLDTISKKVVIEDYDLFIPNAFSPENGGNLNQTFKPLGFGIKQYQLNVFSRWGGNIFTTSLYNEGWNGKHNNSGKDCLPGLYTYVILIEDIFDVIHRYEGKVYLFR